MVRFSRREFARLSAGLSILAQQSSATITRALAKYALQHLRFNDTEAAHQRKPTRRDEVVLEAIIAPHVPELLVLTPTKRSNNALIGSQVWARERAEHNTPDSRVYELRKYAKGAHNPISSLEIFERSGIHPVLQGPVGDEYAYLIGFENLEARSKAWESILDENSHPLGTGYKVSFYRRLI